MKDTVEVRLQVPRKIHELVKRAAEQGLRTTHNQYIFYLSWVFQERLNYLKKDRDEYNGPG